MVSFIVALGLFFGPFKKLSGIGIYITNMTVSLERLMALFQLQPSVREAADPVAMGDFTKGIEFRNVGAFPTATAPFSMMSTSTCRAENASASPAKAARGKARLS